MQYACAVVLPAAQAVFFPTHGADAARGRKLYESRCIGCHSEAVRKSTVVWNDKTLDRWLANPEKLIPGQKMGFSVADPAERADIIEYLRTATDGRRPQRPL